MNGYVCIDNEFNPLLNEHKASLNCWSQLQIHKTSFDWNKHLGNLLEKLHSVLQHFMDEIE